MLDMNKIRYCAEHLSESGLREFVTYLATEVNLAAVRKAAGFANKPISLDSWVATAEVDATPGLREKLIARKAKLTAEYDPYAHDMVSVAEVDESALCNRAKRTQNEDQTEVASALVKLQKE